MNDTGAPWTTSTVHIPSSWGHATPDALFVRGLGDGVPVLLLHGGWGYGIHSFDAVASEITGRGFRCLAPDRTGYGRSTPLSRQPLDFHRRAAREMDALLERLGIGNVILWGHSDGAVIAAWMALEKPQRVRAVVLESFHFWAQKASSRLFFETTAQGGHTLPERTKARLEADHGAHWSDVVAMNGRVWVELGERADGPEADLFDGRLPQVAGPTMLLYGSQDPRMEPGEVAAAHASMPGSQLVLVEGRHVPHGEPTAWAQARGRVVGFVDRAKDQVR